MRSGTGPMLSLTPPSILVNIRSSWLPAAPGSSIISAKEKRPERNPTSALTLPSTATATPTWKACGGLSCSTTSTTGAEKVGTRLCYSTVGGTTRSYRSSRRIHRMEILLPFGSVSTHPTSKEAKPRPRTPWLTTSTSERALGLQPHPLFDPGYYCSQSQTEVLTHVGALAHYLENGDADDGDPHPLFQAQFYMDQFEMDSAPDSNFLIHYLNHGEQQGKLPNPLFDPGHYLELNPDLSVLKIPFLQHYAKSGGKELRATSLLFDARWYTDEHPAAATQPGGPLSYYLTEGDKLGHNPHPLFDASLYGSQHPELSDERGARVRHFVTVGGHDGSNPLQLFHSNFYLSQKPLLHGQQREPPLPLHPRRRSPRPPSQSGI